MKSSLRFAFVFILLTGGAIAETPEDRDKFLEWHKAMIRVRLPKKGCFQVAYPNKVWIKEKCAPTQNRVYMSTAGSGFVGKANNYSAEVTSGHISSSIGSFDSGEVTSESGAPKSTNYSFQLNSQEFDTPACAGTKDRYRCKGLQQFVYTPNTGGGYIQYWLLNYGPECPKTIGGNSNTNWHHPDPESEDCTRFSEFSIAGPKEPPLVSELIHLSLGGTAHAGEWDVLTVRRGDTRLHAVNEDNILNLADGWRMAEFGVFGNGEGFQAEFNPGATLTVRTSVVNGTKDPPKCVRTGVTGEENNLELVEPCCTYGGATPAIVFMMSSNRDAVSPCAPRPVRSK